MATGGCWATARRRRPAPALRWKTASRRRARCPTSMARLHVHRLAGFFRRFRDALIDMAPSPDGRVAILTPGPLNETYFEHAYIARYLGIMLLEGEDLTVTDGRLMVRTVSGPEADQRAVAPARRGLRRSAGTATRTRISARRAWPRRSATARSPIGQRARLRHPGNPRAAGLPADDLRAALRGEELLLPSIATWWCGQEAEREHVHRQSRPHDDRPGAVDPAALRGRQRHRARLDAATDEREALHRPHLQADGARLRRPGGGDAVDDAGLRRRQAGAAAGEPARLSGPHAATAGRSCPAASPASAPSLDTTAIAMQRGGQAADVWVVSRQAGRARRRCCRRERDGFTRNMPGSLPSRAADNLIWLGRYIERAEDTRAHPARLSCPAGRDLRSRHAAAGRHPRLSRTARHRHQDRHPARPGRQPRQRRLQRRPDPRPLFAGRLAGAARSRPRPSTSSPKAWSPATTRRAR